MWSATVNFNFQDLICFIFTGLDNINFYYLKIYEKQFYLCFNTKWFSWIYMSVLSWIHVYDKTR